MKVTLSGCMVIAILLSAQSRAEEWSRFDCKGVEKETSAPVEFQVRVEGSGGFESVPTYVDIFIVSRNSVRLEDPLVYESVTTKDYDRRHCKETAPGRTYLKISHIDSKLEGDMETSSKDYLVKLDCNDEMGNVTLVAQCEER